MSVLRQLERLIQLSRPPVTGSQEEARSAAMMACKMIRENNLSIWDPRAVKSRPNADQISLGDDVDFRRQSEEAIFHNPVRTAMRQRQRERAEAARLRRERERFEVGQPHGDG